MTHIHRTGLRAVRHTEDPADEGPSVPTPWKLRVGIGVPAAGTWASGFGFSLVTMIGHFERSHVDVAPERRPEVVLIAIDGHLPDVRTRILGEAVRERCTHLLWLDSDMIFPPDTLHRLLRHNLPIVGANYPRRIFPHLPTAHYGGDPQGGVVWSEGKAGAEIVKHVGFGCVLMDMRLVDMIDPPYFVFAPDGNHGLTTRGEDVYFCEKALRDAGVPTHVDHDLSHEIGHIGEQVFGLTHAYTGRTVQAEMDAAKAAEDAAAAEAARVASLPIAIGGGTGASTAEEARRALGGPAPYLANAAIEAVAAKEAAAEAAEKERVWAEGDAKFAAELDALFAEQAKAEDAVTRPEDAVTRPEDAGTPIAPDLANAAIEGADVEAVEVRWADAPDDAADWGDAADRSAAE